MGILKKKFRSIKKFPTWIYWLPARLMELIFKLCYRFEVEDRPGIFHNRGGKIAVTWHNRLLFFAVVWPPETRRHTMAVVSASRDGQYIADFISMLGIKSLRGSSSRHGARVQKEAIDAARAHFNVAVTPDGPRGPRYVMKNGPIHLASTAGVPVCPISVNASKCWSLKSWDGFQIPKPGAKLTLVIGDEIPIPPELDADALEHYRKKVESALRAITVDPVS